MIDSPKEWFEIKLQELENNSQRKAVFLEMKSMIMNSEKIVLSEIVQSVSLNLVFECLNSSDKQEIELICSILFELLSQTSANRLFETYGGLLHKALLHPLDEVKEVSLKLIEKNITEMTIENLLTTYTPLLIDVARCLAFSDRRMAQAAVSIFIEIGNKNQGVKLLYSTLLLDKFKEVMTINDISRFRVYEIVVSVSKFSPSNLSASISSGLMANLISEISSPDILIQLNALEILGSLTLSNHGLTYLQECKVIENLADKLLKINEEPLASILLPGLIEFFGNLCSLQPELFTKEYPQVIELLFNSLETTDEVLLGVIISTLGKIGSSCNGRLMLNNHEVQTKLFFKRVGQILTNKSDSTINAMNSLSELIKNINGNGVVTDITKKWFDSIYPNALDSVVTLAKLPFVEFRLAALSLLRSLATQEWGIEKLSNYPGMIEFLTDRSTEFNKDCKQTKFEIVYNMMQSQNISLLVSPQALVTLKEYVKEGPFYVFTPVEPAIGAI